MPDKKKEYKALVIVMYQYDAKTNVEEKRIVKTIDGKERREWMERTIMWATMNGKYVTILNEADDREEV